MNSAETLPIAPDWFSVTWVTGRTAVLTEPHVDELLRANLWYLRGAEASGRGTEHGAVLRRLRRRRGPAQLERRLSG